MVVEPILISPAKAAELLGVSRSTAYLLIRTGQIPVRRVSSRLRVPLEELRAWARRCQPIETPTTSAPEWHEPQVTESCATNFVRREEDGFR